MLVCGLLLPLFSFIGQLMSCQSCCFWSPNPSTLYHGWFGQNRAVTRHWHDTCTLRDIWAMFTMVRYLMKHLDVFLMDLYIWSFLTWKRHMNLSTCTHLDMVAHKTTKQIWKASNEAGFVCLHPHTRKHTQEKEVGHEMSQCEKWMNKYFKIKAARWAVTADGKLLSSCQVNAHLKMK